MIPVHVDLVKNSRNVVEHYRINKVNAATMINVATPNEIPTKENTAFPIQTSLYGASKISAEALISAYSEAYNIKSNIQYKESIEQAIKSIPLKKNDLLIIAGSLYLSGEFLKLN